MHKSFLCITAHYIDSEWILNKRIIIDLALGIRDKIFTITLYNVSDNDATIQRLKRFWQL